MNIKFIRIDRSLHHGFAQAIAGSDEHHILKTRFGVERKHHAGSADVRANHALHTGRQRNFGMGKALVNAVGNGAIIV